MREAEALVYEPVRTEAAFELAIALGHVGDYAGARRQRDDASPLERAETAFALARVSWDLGRDRARAHRLASEAARLWTSAGDGSAEQRRAVEAWLSAHR